MVPKFGLSQLRHARHVGQLRRGSPGQASPFSELFVGQRRQLLPRQQSRQRHRRRIADLATRNGSRLAVGYTPYEFLVQQLHRPRDCIKASQNFTFYFNRDSVTETQLSYCRSCVIRVTASAVFGWPHLGRRNRTTGGGLRFDKGDEHAGFYITADGSDLSGYHVLENTKFEGSMGAYFLAHIPSLATARSTSADRSSACTLRSNERSQSYGLGGYFSPDAYFLASVPDHLHRQLWR